MSTRRPLASLIGAEAFSITGTRLSTIAIPWLVYTVAFLLTGLPRFLALGLGADTALLISTLIVGGFASGFINPILGAVIFERIPAGLRGRVSTLDTAPIPFGGLLGGVLVVLVGVAYAVVTLTPLVRPSFRELSRRPDAPVEVPVAT